MLGVPCLTRWAWVGLIGENFVTCLIPISVPIRLLRTVWVIISTKFWNSVFDQLLLRSEIFFPIQTSFEKIIKVGWKKRCLGERDGWDRWDGKTLSPRITETLSPTFWKNFVTCLIPINASIRLLWTVMGHYFHQMLEFSFWPTFVEKWNIFSSSNVIWKSHKSGLKK